MSFILDALRKSEHERQRTAVPGIAQIPLATPQPQLPRWALVLMGVLGTAVLVLGAAWWQSSRVTADLPTAAAPTVERTVELPPPREPQPTPPGPARDLVQGARATPALTPLSNAVDSAARTDANAQAQVDAPVDVRTLPTAASLAAEGVALPELQLELHAYSEQPRARFVFINGRKYAEGERLSEGPQLLSIEPTGAVLAHLGRRFVLAQE